MVEGTLDEAVVRKIAFRQETPIAQVLVKNGRSNIAKKAADYFRAARHSAWFVLADLDDDVCPGALLGAWGVPSNAGRFGCRIAVREIEAWLLADRDAIASFLKVSRDRIPLDPEKIVDPKRSMVELARHSRVRSIRDAILPTPGAFAATGPGYTSMMIEFCQARWEPTRAARRAPSLTKAMGTLQAVLRDA